MFESTMLSKTMRLHRPRRKGFTLIEVLVVVAIIALLIAILMPSLANARRETKRVVCQTQLREIFAATMNYLQSTQSSDHLPDRDTLGGWWFRYGAELKSINDPRALPETYGLPALYRKTKCLPGKTAVWMCPDTPKEFAYFGNSYAWFIFSPTSSYISRNYSTLMTASRSRPTSVMWVWDNWRYNAPTPSGANYTRPVRNPDDPETSTAPDSYLTRNKPWYYPHSTSTALFQWGGNTEGAKAKNINVVRLDGSVMRFNPKFRN